VTDGLASERCAANSIASLLDVVDELLGLSTSTGVVLDTGRRNAVEVLTADRDTLDEIGESGAVLGNGCFESRDLVVEVGLASGRPHAKEKGGLCVDGSLNGLDDGIGGAVLDPFQGVSTGNVRILSSEGLQALLSSSEFAKTYMV
jgi:hypothetical protein